MYISAVRYQAYGTLSFLLLCSLSIAPVRGISVLAATALHLSISAPMTKGQKCEHNEGHG